MVNLGGCVCCGCGLCGKFEWVDETTLDMQVTGFPQTTVHGAWTYESETGVYSDVTHATNAQYELAWSQRLTEIDASGYRVYFWSIPYYFVFICFFFLYAHQTCTYV